MKEKSYCRSKVQKSNLDLVQICIPQTNTFYIISYRKYSELHRILLAFIIAAECYKLYKQQLMKHVCLAASPLLPLAAYFYTVSCGCLTQCFTTRRGWRFFFHYKKNYKQINGIDTSKEICRLSSFIEL